MMVQECTSTCYVLFWIMIVSANDPKDLFVERVTMFPAQSIWLKWVGLVEYQVVFLVLRIFGAEGQDVTTWT
jgi:hypothetical protein